jgi:hypothetical protein
MVMEFIIYLYTVIDTFLMYFYRLSSNPLIGYFLGTFLLSFACVIIGKYSMSIAFRFNKDHIKHDNHNVEHYQNLSIEALKAGDKAAFKACNSIANNAYGKNFFSQIALAASSLWPVFIALGWMQYRFSGVEIVLPVLGGIFSFGYIISFALCYIAARILFGKIKNDFQRIVDNA